MVGSGASSDCRPAFWRRFSYQRDLVVKAGRGEDVEIAIAVHVRRKHAGGPVRGGTDRVGGEVLAAVVLVPGDLVVIEGRGEDVDVAVAVHVRRKHLPCPVGGGADGVGGEVLAAVVLVPGDLVVDRDAERTSVSPSPSTSAANTLKGPSAAVLMVWGVKFWLPSFSYQAILSSNAEAERTSVSPSPSTSAANTLRAPSAAVLMVWAVKFWLPSFSYQAILSS